MKIGRLRALRERMGISQTELAKRMGIVRPTYSNYEAGNREPDFETIKRLAEFFSVSIDYLLENDLDATKTEKGENAEERKMKEIERIIRRITLNKGIDETIEFLNYVDEESKKRNQK